MPPSGLTPAARGFHMPAEWEPHAATWLAWPHNADSWPGKLEVIPPVWAAIIGALASSEPVNVLVCNEEMDAEARRVLRGAEVPLERVHLRQIRTDDAWMRDSGPTFVVHDAAGGREAAIVDWGFNKWGGKYPPWDQDDLVPGRIGALLDMPVFHPGVILEGGSIDVNGRGTLLTTESCLLNPNRNPHLDRAQIETVLREHLGVRHILWLGEGIAGDDTDGHIDDLTRFVDATTVVTVRGADRDDVNHEVLEGNYHRLCEMTDQDGRRLRVVSLPMPAPVTYQGQRLPASYANFYIANRVVLVPTFAQPSDAVAVETLQSLFPERRVVGIHSVDLIWGLGAIHCITQQQPVGVPARW